MIDCPTCRNYWNDAHCVTTDADATISWGNVYHNGDPGV